MSRFYEMMVEVTDHDVKNNDAIIDAVRDHWEFDSIQPYTTSATRYLTLCGRDYLVGGESEEEFAHRLTKAIWKANGAYCRVVIYATNLECLPNNRHEHTEDEYTTIMGEDRHEKETVPQ